MASYAKSSRRSIYYKGYNKGSCVVVLGREDYLGEEYKQPNDTSIYVEGKKYKSTMIDYYHNLKKKSN